MNMLLQNANLAWLAGLIAAPLLLHLFARTRPPRFLFSATEFVRRAVRKTMRLRRPRDWLLLACRTLAVAALVGAFLRPVLFLEGMPEVGGPSRTLVVIVDRTASMAWSEGGQSRFAAACAAASQLLAGLTSRDSADLVWLDSEPEAVFPEPGPNAAYLRQRLADAHVTNESGDPAAAIERARSLLESAGGTRELCIISDFQAAQWADVTIKLPEGVRLHTLPVGRAEAGNGCVVEMRSYPPAPVVGEPVQILCEMANFSSEARARIATIEIGEARVSRQVMLAPWGRAVASVDHVFRKPGPHVVQARLDDDAFGADDWRGAIVPVRDALRVGVLGADPRVAPVWLRALGAIPWTAPLRVNGGDLSAAGACDLLMVAGWDGGAMAPLKELRLAGLPMIIAPKAGLDLRAVQELMGERGEGGAAAWEVLKEPVGMTVDDHEHPVFALFRSGEYGDPARAAFRMRWRLPLPTPRGRTLMRFADGPAAILLCEANPPVLLWAAPLSAPESDWASHASFLPWFGELVGSLRARRSGMVPPTMLPGERLTWRTSGRDAGVRLAGSGDAIIGTSATAAGSDGWRYISAPIASPGVFRWLVDEECRETQIINFPNIESDLRAGMPPSAGAVAGGVLRSARELSRKDGTPLWKFLAWSCLAALMVESGIVFLSDRERRASAEASP